MKKEINITKTMEAELALLKNELEYPAILTSYDDIVESQTDFFTITSQSFARYKNLGWLRMQIKPTQDMSINNFVELGDLKNGIKPLRNCFRVTYSVNSAISVRILADSGRIALKTLNADLAANKTIEIDQIYFIK